jgi:hypothetical protein
MASISPFEQASLRRAARKIQLAQRGLGPVGGSLNATVVARFNEAAGLQLPEEILSPDLERTSAIGLARCGGPDEIASSSPAGLLSAPTTSLTSALAPGEGEPGKVESIGTTVTRSRRMRWDCTTRSLTALELTRKCVASRRDRLCIVRCTRGRRSPRFRWLPMTAGTPASRAAGSARILV